MLPGITQSSREIHNDMLQKRDHRKRKPRPGPKASVEAGAVPAAELRAQFPKINLPLRPPFAPMEAKSVKEIPEDSGWQYEPKWDGFRALVFRVGDQVVLQSKAGQPLDRYFPELVEAIRSLNAEKFVLDAEIVVEIEGELSFDALLQRIHPAASRIRRLAAETPATLLVFDLLLDDEGNKLTNRPLSERRRRLKECFRKMRHSSRVRLSPATTDLNKARRWMTDYAKTGCDGIIAKRLELPYLSGDRSGVVKIKRLRTADCVVGGFRYAQKGDQIGSLLLGLYNQSGKLNHVGFSSSFKSEERAKLKKIVEPLVGGAGFTGNAPGGPSRWATERSTAWQPLAPKLVCEVQYDHFSGGRFRHGKKFLRWRPEKDPRACTFEQLKVIRPKRAA